MDAQHSEMNVSVHPEASSQPPAVDTELHSLNQLQYMDKPTEQPEMDYGITVSIITGSDIETVETDSVKVDPEIVNPDDCDAIVVSSDSDAKSSVPASDLTKPSFKDFSFSNFMK